MEMIFNAMENTLIERTDVFMCTEQLCVLYSYGGWAKELYVDFELHKDSALLTPVLLEGELYTESHKEF